MLGVDVRIVGARRARPLYSDETPCGWRKGARGAPLRRQGLSRHPQI